MKRIRGLVNNSKGGVIVTVALSMTALVAMVALGVDVFRLLTSRIQMQNFAEYTAEVVLAQIRSGSVNASGVLLNADVQDQILKVVNENMMLGESEDSSNYGVGEICFNEGVCSGAVTIRAGCYNMTSYNFSWPSPALGCAAGTYQAVYVKLKTSTSGRKYSVFFKGIMSAVDGFSTTAFSYNASGLVGAGTPAPTPAPPSAPIVFQTGVYPPHGSVTAVPAL